MEENLKNNIQQHIEKQMKQKMIDYKPETTYNPFISSFVDSKQVKISSFIHSLYTSIGMSIYEQIGKLIAKQKGYHVEHQHKIGGDIDYHTSKYIETLINQNNYQPNKEKEISEIRNKIIKFNNNPKESNQFDNIRTVDLFIKKKNNHNQYREIYIDVASPKLNYKEFTALKRKMLQWVALRLSQDQTVNIETYIGIPFNPYYPQEYKRWTGFHCDRKGDLLIQDELWKEIAGKDIYEELKTIFEKSGTNLKSHVNKFLSYIKKTDIPNNKDIESDIDMILYQASNNNSNYVKISNYIEDLLRKIDNLFFTSDKVEKINNFYNKIIKQGKSKLNINQERITIKILDWGIKQVNKKEEIK